MVKYITNLFEYKQIEKIADEAIENNIKSVIVNCVKDMRKLQEDDYEDMCKNADINGFSRPHENMKLNLEGFWKKIAEETAKNGLNNTIKNNSLNNYYGIIEYMRNASINFLNKEVDEINHQIHLIEDLKNKEDNKLVKENGDDFEFRF